MIQMEVSAINGLTVVTPRGLKLAQMMDDLHALDSECCSGVLSLLNRTVAF